MFWYKEEQPVVFLMPRPLSNQNLGLGQPYREAHLASLGSQPTTK